jgi:IPT/TIG domain
MQKTLIRAVLRVCVAVLLLFAARSTFGQTPVITSLSPSTVAAGSGAFTLTVNGSNFVAAASIQANGSNLATVFLSATQLQATVPAALTAAPGSVAITVFNPVVGVPGGGFTSNTALLTVGAAPGPPPVLISASPGLAAQGASQLRLTLLGRDFRPGATVVISPPLPSVTASTGTVQASDVAVDGVTFVNPNVLVAYVSLSPTAAAGLRAVDVLNSDGTSTGFGGAPPGSSQPLQISLSNSLGAPLAIATVAVISPRPGTLVAQGDELYGQAILAGAGSGTVTGEWLWDGNVTEQFATTLAGGQSVTLTSQRSFPTSFLGVHTLELRITQPNRLEARPITVVVNPGTWKIERLLSPPYGAHVDSSRSPNLLWAPVPVAAKYQVGFSTRPYFSTVTEWHDVTDNHWIVPPDVWGTLPEGELYWTVRVVEMSGTTRKPLPMRMILRAPADALTAVSRRAGLTPQGNPLIEWHGFSGKHLYLVTISLDPEGTQLVRRYLTSQPRVDLRALKGKLQPDTSYFWRVDAIARDGRTILAGTPQLLILPEGTPSTEDVRPFEARMMLASLRSEASSRLARAEPAAGEVSTLGNRSPAPDSTVTDPKAPITLQFTTAPNVFDLAIQVDAVDVTSMADVADTKVTYTPATPLANGKHTVQVTLGSESSQWTFTVKAAAGGASSATSDAEAPPKKSAANGKTKEGVSPVQMDTQISSNTQWVSGSSPDSNGLTFGQQTVYRNGGWNVQMNGSGLLNSTLNPYQARTSLGQVSNYITQVGVQRGAWGINVRFGTLAPALYLNSQFVTTAAPRQGVETMLHSPVGTFGFFANTEDNLLGSGSGAAFHQQLAGASWDAPLPKKYVEFRFMWLYARDTGKAFEQTLDSQGNPITSTNFIATAGGGNAYGGLLLVHLSPNWDWASEYAWSYDTPDLVTSSTHFFGRAWRSGIAGRIKTAALNIAYIDVGPNFETPANPGLSLLSNPDRRGFASSLALPTRAGTFTVSDQSLASNYKQASFPEQIMNAITESWSKNLTRTAALNISSHQTITTTGTVPPAVQMLPPDQQLALEADQRDLGANVSLTRQVGKIMLSIGGARDWFRNNLFRTADTITSSLLTGANWNYAQFFQLNANVSVNWINADKETIGATHTLSGYLQPTFNWQRAHFQVQPLASYNQTRTALGSGLLINDSNTGQYGGRLMWMMPGDLKFSTLSFEGDYTLSRNPLANQDFRTTTALLVWTVVWDHKTGM